MQLLLLQSMPKLLVNQKRNLYFAMKTVTVPFIMAIPGEETGIGVMEAEIGDSNPPQPKKGGNDMKGILNPVDRDGNIARCRTLDRKYHWQSECPYDQKHQIK